MFFSIEKHKSSDLPSRLGHAGAFVFLKYALKLRHKLCMDFIHLKATKNLDEENQMKSL